MVHKPDVYLTQGNGGMKLSWCLVCKAKANLGKTSVVVDLLGLTVFQATENLLNTVMVAYY